MQIYPCIADENGLLDDSLGVGFFPPFVHVDRGGGVCKMSTLVHTRGEGVKKGQNLVHVVVECPLSKSQKKVLVSSHTYSKKPTIFFTLHCILELISVRNQSLQKKAEKRFGFSACHQLTRFLIVICKMID